MTYAFNRPNALNALNMAQVVHIEKQIRDLRSNPACSAVLFLGEGERAFCAGGDVLQISRSAAEKSDWNRRWFSSEFLLNYFLSTFGKPVVSIWRGIVMGGGVGVSIYGSHRIATDTTMFAMPETGIGFFPDVGASFFLSHLTVKYPGLGLYLGMTGHRLGGADAFKCGLATHFVPGERIADLVSSLERAGDVPSVVSQFHASPPAGSLTPEFLESVERYFSKFDCFGNFLDHLKNSNSPFAIATLKTLRSKCPLTVRVWFDSFKIGSSQSLLEVLDREYRMCIRVTETDSHNFREGVRAQLVDKGKGAPPEYRPARLEDVTDEMVSEILNAQIGGDLAACMRGNKLMYE